MPNSNQNLLEIAKINSDDRVVALIEEVITETPELEIVPAIPVPGTSFKALIRDALPPVEFRNANEGVTPGRSNFKTKLQEMVILDGQIEMDVRVADADVRGPAHILGLEEKGIAKSALLKLAHQFYYGTSADSDKGFVGLKEFTPLAGEYTLNAGGTTADTASSLFAIKLGDEHTNFMWGENTTLTLGDYRIQQLTDKNGKKFTGYVNDLGGWCGLAMTSKWSAGRIANLTEDAGNGLTVERVLEFFELFPRSKQPDVCFITRRSLTQLRKDMSPKISIKSTAAQTNPVTPKQALDYIEESTGARFVVSDTIVNNDAIES